jgi:ketosteroid isomerase-like protein
MSDCVSAGEALPGVYEAFSAAIERQDSQALAKFYTSDYRFFPTGCEVVSGYEALLGFFDAFWELGITRCSFETFEIEQHGEIAYETGRVTLYVEGDVEAGTMKYLVIWKCEEGTWLVHRDILSADAPAS